MNNKHQELIAEKVAEFNKLVDDDYYEFKEITDTKQLEGTLWTEEYWPESQVELDVDKVRNFLTKTMQETIDTVSMIVREEEATEYNKIIDTVLEEERGRIKIDSNDMQKVGDHYWGGDYEPTYYELEKLTESMNEILQTKLKALDKTPPNKV